MPLIRSHQKERKALPIRLQLRDRQTNNDCHPDNNRQLNNECHPDRSAAKWRDPPER